MSEELVDLDALEAVARAATPGPWVKGDHFHIQGADLCECLPGYGDLMWEGVRDINGQKMPAHVHYRKEPWWELGIQAIRRDGPVAVVIETEEYGAMSARDADYIATFNPDIVLALIAELRILRATKLEGGK